MRSATKWQRQNKVIDASYRVEKMEAALKESEKPLDDKLVFLFGTRKRRKFTGKGLEEWHAWVAEFDALIKPYKNRRKKACRPERICDWEGRRVH